MKLKALVRSPVGNRVTFFVLAAVIGVVVGLATVGLISLISLVQYVGFGASSEARFATIAAAAPGWRVLLTPFIGGLVVGGIIYFLPSKRYHGIADVMEACAFNSGRMGVRSGSVLHLRQVCLLVPVHHWDVKVRPYISVHRSVPGLQKHWALTATSRWPCWVVVPQRR